MSNYEIKDAADYADNFYAMDAFAACDVCEDDADYAHAEFGGACPECAYDSEGDLSRPEDAALEFSLFMD